MGTQKRKTRRLTCGTPSAAEQFPLRRFFFSSRTTPRAKPAESRAKIFLTHSLRMSSAFCVRKKSGWLSCCASQPLPAADRPSLHIRREHRNLPTRVFNPTHPTLRRGITSFRRRKSGKYLSADRQAGLPFVLASFRYLLKPLCRTGTQQVRAFPAPPRPLCSVNQTEFSLLHLVRLNIFGVDCY